VDPVPKHSASQAESCVKVTDQAQGRWPAILIALGVPEQYLENRHGPCPICGDGKDRFRFDDKEGRGTYYCNVCGAGDGFKLLMGYYGWSFAEAAEKVEGVVGTCSEAPKKTNVDPAVRLRKIAANAKRLNGNDPASTYLKARKLIAPSVLRYSEAEPYYEDGRAVGSYPAMLGLVSSPIGKPVTWHVTYLKDGKKAPVSSPKKVMKAVEKVSGAAIRLYPLASHIGIAEGIETAIAAHHFTGLPVWSVISAGGMESFIPPSVVKAITIFGDNDLNYTGQKAAYVLAHRLATRLSLMVRVEIPAASGEDWADFYESFFVDGHDSNTR